MVYHKLPNIVVHVSHRLISKLVEIMITRRLVLYACQRKLVVEHLLQEPNVSFTIELVETVEEELLQTFKRTSFQSTFHIIFILFDAHGMFDSSIKN